jgi:DNA-directed RNA polymerase specialized sigma24 family protein
MNFSSLDRSRTHASLLIRLRDNSDQQAWEEFHERYAPMIRGWCRQWFPRELDDMVQEVLTRLVSSLKNFESVVSSA